MPPNLSIRGHKNTSNAHNSGKVYSTITKLQCTYLFLPLYQKNSDFFNDAEEEGFRKHCGKRRKCWQPAFSPFPTMFSNLQGTNFVIYAIFKMSSANAFNSDQSKIFCLGKS